MIGEKELTFDTSVIIKGIIPPKRRDEDGNERIRKFKENYSMENLVTHQLLITLTSFVLPFTPSSSTR